MTPNNLPPLMPARISRALGWCVLYFVLLVTVFTFPRKAEFGLDPSWRMAMAYMFDHGLQFGVDVVWTYGPLGMIMSNTYSGILFWHLIAGQLALAIIAATVIIRQGVRLTGSPRVIFFGFFLLFGIPYEDALHMLVIVLLGFELLRNSNARWDFRTALIAWILGFYSQIKFTDFTLSTALVLVVCAYCLWMRYWRNALLLALTFFTTFLVIWVLCGQQLANLPTYFINSWAISQSYQWAMAIPSPPTAFALGLIVLLSLVLYAFCHLKLNPDKPRAIANVLILGAFIYLNWKHGFVRSDGHMIGFFFCAMLPLVAYPSLLDDPDRFRHVHRWAFVLLLVLSILGTESALNGVTRGIFSLMESRFWDKLYSVSHWTNTRQLYRENLGAQRAGADLSQTHAVIGQSTVDILGVEQSVALLNRFNYKPRPVMQSYSTWNPRLAQLNYDFYASDEAPEYVLIKVQTIDDRLPVIDDSLVLRLLIYRYEFVRGEKGFLLWKKKSGPFDATQFDPKPLHTEMLPVGQSLSLQPWSDRPLWLKIDLKPSPLGAARVFFYKPPMVQLVVKNAAGNNRSFLLPVTMAQTGFIVSPLIDDPASLMEFAANRSKRQVGSVHLEIAPEDQKYFADAAEFSLSELPIPDSGEKYFSYTLSQHVPYV